VHAAKGLEFPYVYIVGLEENLFPSIQSLSSRADMEEERRLFYVALTRAEQKVSISYAENRYRWGNLTICEPSRFIEEIDEKYLELPKKTSIHANKFKNDYFNKNKKSSSLNFRGKKLNKITYIENSHFNNDFLNQVTDKLQTGMKVEHQRFGKGKIISIEGTGSNKKATVFFNGIGQKQLLLKFAKLKIL
ncbi:MAG: ATP-binding domain-containing protein, partial [Bacteroidales bacterium]|nr:ATP-binding domain-containing protein [Bacteroidales bacterium]